MNSNARKSCAIPGATLFLPSFAYCRPGIMMKTTIATTRNSAEATALGVTTFVLYLRQTQRGY